MDINRKTAYNTLLEIEKAKAFSNLELNKQINFLRPDSPAFVRELVYGVMENKIFIDYVLTQLIPKGLRGIKTPVLTVLRMGVYQVAFMDSVPDYAAVNESVILAKKVARGRDGFVNGVLRGFIKRKEEFLIENMDNSSEKNLSLKYSFEPWIVKLWVEQYGIETAEKLMKACNQAAPMSIRVNWMKNSTDQLKKSLEDQGFEVEYGTISDRILFVKGSNLLKTVDYEEGRFSVQDEASLVAAETLGAKKGEVIFDMCAAPGGKTLAMAEIMENRGRIIAFDVYRHKLQLIEKSAARLGITIVSVEENDGRYLNRALMEKADRVLVDAPCTGLGVIRRKPEIKYRNLSDMGKGLAEIQYKILETSAGYVKKGGTLLYSTCTINKIENTDVVSKFLKEKGKSFELVRSRQFLPGKDSTDGFYICKMRKKNF